MPKQYSSKNFFRNAPNCFLQQYFSKHNVLSEIDFSKLPDAKTEKKVKPIYESWLKLPEETRAKMEQDLQEINSLATEGGSKAIIDEAYWHGEELAEQFAALDSFHGRAFWTFLERPKYWAGAIAFSNADNVPNSYWRKRKNIPCKAANTDEKNILKFAQTISNYFHTTQGRGKNCHVDCYKRNDLDYFFAYPEDYAQTSIEWYGNNLEPRPHHPAFEIIFVYSQNNGTLEIYASSDRKTVPILQDIFVDIILQEVLTPDEKDERVYNLNQMLSRDFDFIYDAECGIENVDIKKFHLKILGRSEKITLEVDPTQNKNAILDLLDKLTNTIPIHQLSLTQVGIKVTFANDPTSRKINTRTFNISYPNSCSLKNDERDLIIRQVLIDSKIEPKAVASLPK